MTMTQLFCLSPRYRLDDESPWLEGIDPARNYWIAVNGDAAITVSIPGLTVSSSRDLKQAIRQFRGLEPGEQMTLVRIASTCTLYCVSLDCYAVEAEVNQAPVWHLFDQETLESLLMSAHPDWQSSSKDIEVGRKLLVRSLQHSRVA